MAAKNILIIYNPAARGGKSHLVQKAFTTFLQKENINFDVYETTANEDTKQIKKLISNNQYDLISIVGGDGTINLAINALPHFDLPVLIIPAGSGNDLVKMLHYNKNIEEIFSLAVAPNPEIRAMDLWRCNDRLFANGFGAGFDGAIANKTANKKSFLPSKLKYWIEIIRHIFFYSSPNFKVNGISYPTFMISIANGRVYGGDFKVAPLANISDGILEVIRIKKVVVPLRFLYLPLVQLGKHLNKKPIKYTQESRIIITSEENLDAHLDGEPISESSYHITFESKLDVLI